MMGIPPGSVDESATWRHQNLGCLGKTQWKSEKDDFGERAKNSSNIPVVPHEAVPEVSKK